MTEAERISCFANVPPLLAELVVTAATLSRRHVRDIRGGSRARDLVGARRWVIKRARPRFSCWEIGRALNRDHSVVVHHERILRLGIEPELGRPSKQRQLELFR